MTIDRRVVAAAAPALAELPDVVAPSADIADALRRCGVAARPVALESLTPDGTGAVALLADELSDATHDEVLLAQAAHVLRPGGVLAVSARSSVSQAARNATAGRGYRAEDVERALGHHGIATELLCAPGAAAIVAGDADGPANVELDRERGILDAAPRILAVGRRGATPDERSATYFATLPRKIVAAAVLCRDGDGRVLVVHDSFKGHWTIPGGVVDRREDPRSGAAREAWEEAGVRVVASRPLGLFAGRWPDRLVVVYDASPEPGESAPRGPVNAHEIDAVEWISVADALERLAPHVAFQVRACLDDPGGTHVVP